MISFITPQGKITKDSISGFNKPNDTIAILDHKQLHRTIVNKVANELQYLSNDCYYPKTADIFKELMVQCQTDEKKLNAYSKARFKPFPRWKNAKIANDSKTTLIVLILEDFIDKKDNAAAIQCINLLALRFYTNILRKFITFCNPNYFRGALNRLSHNHLFIKKKSIGASILHLGYEVFVKNKTYFEKDDVEQIAKTIYELRGRINQSIKSFAIKYYEISKDQTSIKLQDEDLPDQQTIDKQIRVKSGNLARELTIYGHKDYEALRYAQRITKQNQKLANEYITELSNSKYNNDLELAFYLFMKAARQEGATSKLDYVNLSKTLMSIKVSTQPVYYKKSIIKIHDEIVNDLGYSSYFDKLSIQSKGISRRFFSYYIAMTIYNFLHT